MSLDSHQTEYTQQRNNTLVNDLKQVYFKLSET